MRSRINILVYILISSFLLAPAYGAIKEPSGSCKILNQTTIYKNYTYKCSIFGKRLIWKKYLKIVPKTPLPNPSPSKTVNPLIDIKNRISNRELFTDVTTCKLRSPYTDTFNSAVRIGFPRSDQRIPNIENPKLLMIYIDYLDAKGTDNPLVDAPRIYSKFVDYFYSVSYGKSKWTVDVYPNYVHINKKMSEYNITDDRNYDVFNQIKDAIDAADSFVDMTKFDQIVFIPPINLIFPVGPALQNMSDRIQYLTSSKGVLKNVAVAGLDWRNDDKAWLWLVHETGHNYGLIHHSLDTDSGFTRPVWDAMAAMEINHSELFSWSRWLIGWIQDNEVECRKPSKTSTVHYISNLEHSDSETKMVVIPLSELTAIIVESRRNGGFDHLNLKEEGLLVYKLDVSKRMGEGAITMAKTTPTVADGSILGNLSVGEIVEIEGVKIKYLERGLSGDYFEVTA